MKKYFLTKLGQAGRQNIWISVMAHGTTLPVFHVLELNTFPSSPPTQSLSIYILLGDNYTTTTFKSISRNCDYFTLMTSLSCGYHVSKENDTTVGNVEEGVNNTHPLIYKCINV